MKPRLSVGGSDSESWLYILVTVIKTGLENARPASRYEWMGASNFVLRHRRRTSALEFMNAPSFVFQSVHEKIVK
ncbi:hypothetical protein M378DRAFT_164652 [Amanita muscaria Koide BX008]|uniref:Uncharacterized protein n=1 Tax=Amanita muscaria (strain Koide BX008) TaxID=946122 RepID=A0A0C2X3N2_AMAMK|nr:hypothetical protein M378DRAFT_164652 [Amanita muscaria Koide BX008]